METYLASVLDGEISSFEPLVNEHQGEVWAILGVLHLDQQRTAAVARQVFESIYEHLTQYDPKYPFKAFVRTLARQTVRDYLHQQAGGGPLPVYAAYVAKLFTDDAAAAAHLHKINQRLEQQAGELPVFVKQLLHRRYDLGEDYQKIAHASDRPVAAVRQTLRRALTDLADQLMHRTRTDPNQPWTEGEELTLKLIDGSIEDHECVALERLLVTQTDEVPRHIAMMEVESWLRGRWRDPKLGRAVLNAVQQTLMKKRARPAPAPAPGTPGSPGSVPPVIADPQLAAVAAGAAQARYRRRRPRHRFPIGLLMFLLIAAALAVAGWSVYRNQIRRMMIPADALRLASFEGDVKIRIGPTKYEPAVNLILDQPAAVICGPSSSATLQYEPQTRLTLDGASQLSTGSDASAARLLTLDHGSVTLDREAHAPGVAPLLIAAQARVIPLDETTQVKVELLDQGAKVSVINGSASVENHAVGQNITLLAGQFVMVAPDLPLRARSSDALHRVTDGLAALYRFNEGHGVTIHDLSGAGKPLDLTIDDEAAVHWGNLSLTVAKPTNILSQQVATKLIDACKSSGELTIEAWIVPTHADQVGTLLAMASEPLYRNFAMYQGDPSGGHIGQFGLLLRTRDGNSAGEPASFSAEKSVASELTQLVVVHDKSGSTRWFLNGKPAGQSQQTGDLGRWAGDHALMLGNEPAGEHPWLGAYRLLAIYSRALDEKDIAHNYDVGLLEPPPEVAKPVQSNQPAAAAKPVKTGYTEVFYLAGTGPLRTTPFTIGSADYRIRLKVTIPAGSTAPVTLRQMDEDSDNAQEVATVSKSGMQIYTGKMKPGNYTLLLNCDADVEWVMSIEEMRELDKDQAPTPLRPEFSAPAPEVKLSRKLSSPGS